MKRVREIQKAIEELSDKDRGKLRKWFIEREWKKWDEQIKRDSSEGELDFLIEEAKEQVSGIR